MQWQNPHNHWHCPAGLVEVIWWSIPAAHLLLAAAAVPAIVIPVRVRVGVYPVVLSEKSGETKSPVRRKVGTRTSTTSWCHCRRRNWQPASKHAKKSAFREEMNDLGLSACNINKDFPRSQLQVPWGAREWRLKFKVPWLARSRTDFWGFSINWSEIELNVECSSRWDFGNNLVSLWDIKKMCDE